MSDHDTTDILLTDADPVELEKLRESLAGDFLISVCSRPGDASRLMREGDIRIVVYSPGAEEGEALEFVRYIKDILGPDLPEPLFLHCSKEIVLGYLKKVQYNFGTEVENYIGEFANENHLEIAAENKFIYFGNHLYNHYVPKLMTDEDLIDCFEKNVNALKKYKNYRNLFSFPFGQPNSCFTGHQVSLLRDRFSTQIFASSQRINYNLEFPLDRISLTTEHNSPTKIWFETFKHRVRDQIYWPSTS